MAEGESIRGLPSLNQPIIDQAKILNEAEIQQLNQKILSLYQQGKAQIGVVIVPTTGQEAIFDYALRAGETWQLGSAKIMWGNFVGTTGDFLVIALVVYVGVKILELDKLDKKKA